MVEEAKAIAHFPPPRLYGSSRLSAALPPGSPAPPPAAVDHSGETKAEGNTKTDEEEDLPDFPFPVSPSDTWALMQTMQQFYHSGRTIINHDTIVGRKLYNFRDLSGTPDPAGAMCSQLHQLHISWLTLNFMHRRRNAEHAARSQGGATEDLPVRCLM
jgi:hypothetical protein